MKVHHIGYLVKKIEKAEKAFQELGYTVKQAVLLDEFRQVQICFMEKDGYIVELVSPVSKESVVSGLMKKLGNTAYHICYETDHMEEDLEKLLHKNYVLCSERHEAAALGNRQVCFLVHPYLGMIELLET